MNFLTKLFVVLLVLTSIILTAGVVTFVNRLEPMKLNIDAKEKQISLLTAQSEQAQAAISASQNSLKEAQASAQTSVDAIRAELTNAQKTQDDRDASIAALKSQIATLTGNNSSMSSALSASQEQQKLIQEQLASLRTSNDKLQVEKTDQGKRISDLTAQLEQTENARRFAVEQLSNITAKADKQSKLLTDMGVGVANLDTAGTKAGAPAVNGIIRNRRTIAGREYATISIGSKDKVIKGMEFRILDKTSGKFLGLLTVDVVDENEAIGRIDADGNNLSAIGPGNEVRTAAQL